MSQGTMSAAIARGNLAYHRLLEQVLCKDGKPTPYPFFQLPGLRINLEYVLKDLEKKSGSDNNIDNPVEWYKSIRHINKLLNKEEEYYERGIGRLGRKRQPKVKGFKNLSIDGFKVAESWKVNPKLCREIVTESPDANRNSKWSTANHPYYRNAYYVLNPTGVQKYEEFSQIDWLKHYAESEGIENVVLMLGANNALGTILHLDVKQSEVIDGELPHEADHEVREYHKWNLWHPDHFHAEYEAFLEKVSEALKNNKCEKCNVFVGNVPHVTIAPLAKGFGPVTPDQNGRLYYKYYGYFFFDEELAKTTDIQLNLMEARFIDSCIDKFNESISSRIANKKGYHLVDLNKTLSDLAWKRNGGNPPYEMPEFLKFKYPPINTKYYHASKDGRFRQGGIFSLDGVHPSAIGQGIMAREILKVMKKAKVKNHQNKIVDSERDLDWQEIWDNDSLIQDPVRLMHELYKLDHLAAFMLGKGSFHELFFDSIKMIFR